MRGECTPLLHHLDVLLDIDLPRAAASGALLGVDAPTYTSEAHSLATPRSESSDALTSARELDLPEAPRK